MGSKASSVSSTLYGKSLKIDVLEGSCSGCLGKKDNSAKDQPVLLCDGVGCCREYHLGCTDPQLDEIPEGNFFCADCDPIGTTRQLEQYFDEAIDEKSRFSSSRKYVESLVRQQMETDSGVDDSNEHKVESKIGSSKKRKHDAIDSPSSNGRDAPPKSDISRTEGLHNAAMNDAKWRKDGKGTQHKKAVGREFLVGKIIKVYCTKDNQYHTGRILDWRSALAPGLDPKKSREQFYGYGCISATEFLVRFGTGLNGRKKTLLQWMILEEHSCAVATSVVMALRDKGRGMNGWRPAQLMLRSCLELVPVRNMISDFGTFALVTFFGSESSIYLDLGTDAVDVASVPFQEEFQRRTATGKTTKNFHIQKLMLLAMNSMNIELEEQKRTFKWHSMPKINVYHEKALTMIDEYSSELTFDVKGCHKAMHKNTQDGFPVPALCPMIQRTLDKKLIYGLITSNNGSLDPMASISAKRSTSPRYIATAMITCSHRP